MAEKDDFVVINSPTLDLLLEMIPKNEYIKDFKSNKQKDPDSVAYLIRRDMSQRECVKFGNCFEKLLTDITVQLVTHLQPKSIKNKYNVFVDEEYKIVYYAELKADYSKNTECMVDELKKEVPGYTVKWCVLLYRYIASEYIPTDILKKYIKISQNVYGINDYLEMVGIDFRFTEETYKYYLNLIADEMFANE
jgi:hypothetical protein